MSLRGKAAIIGIGEFKPTRYTEGATTLGMLAEVARQAIADAGLEMGEVDGVITESFAEVPFMAPSTVVEYLGMKARFAEVVDLGGATGAGMAWRAAAAIASGMCETVVCLTAARREQRTTAGPRRSANTGWAGAPQRPLALLRIRSALRRNRRELRLRPDRQPLHVTNTNSSPNSSRRSLSPSATTPATTRTRSSSASRSASKTSSTAR